MSSNQLADSSRLRKIRIVSRIFRMLLVIAAGLMVGGVFVWSQSLISTHL